MFQIFAGRFFNDNVVGLIKKLQGSVATSKHYNFAVDHFSVQSVAAEIGRSGLIWVLGLIWRTYLIYTYS